MDNPAPRYATFGWVAFAALVADQVTKWLVVAFIPYPTYHPGVGAGEPIRVLGDAVWLVHVGNKGAAWGLGAGLPGTQLFLVGLALAVLALVGFKRREFLHELAGGQLAVGLFVGGALGNVIDRVARDHVVDFVDIHLPFELLGSRRWPAFNVADACICVGVALYFAFLWRQDRALRRRIADQSGRGTADRGPADS
ncbi:MAG: signal peptidase II [Opitutia bacterium]